MAKRKREDDVVTTHKKAVSNFISAWLKELVETETVELKLVQRIELGIVYFF